MSLQDQLSAAIAAVNSQKTPKQANSKGDGRGVSLRRERNGNDFESGGVDDEDENDETPDRPQPRTNERGIRKELAAAIIGVAPASITSWIRRGRIQMTHDDFVPIREVRRMTIEVSLQKNRGRPEEDGGTNTDVMAKHRLDSAKADIAEIDLEVKRRNLVSRNAARKAFEEAAVVTKQRVLAVVDTIVAELQGKKDSNVMGNIIRKHLTGTLITLSKGIRLSGETVTVEETPEEGTKEDSL